MDEALLNPPVNINEVAAAVTTQHGHRRISTVNDHVVTVAVNEVPFPWHSHPNSDEFFLVVEGRLRVEYHDGPQHTLESNDTLLVPAGTVHRTVPEGRTVNLLVERRETETVFLEEADGADC